MKKSLVAAILGLAAVASSAFGQGHVIVSNYALPPYNQVFWNPTTPTVGGQAVRTSSVTLTLWYGLGNISDPNLLTAGQTFTVDTSGDSTLYDPNSGHGAGGFFSIIGVVPTWSSGVATFQIRASGSTAFGVVDQASSRSVLWTETLGSTASPAPAGTFSPGVVVTVPEPSTFALAGLGSAAMLIFRRRKA